MHSSFHIKIGKEKNRMREKGNWSDKTYNSRAKTAKSEGSATFEGEQRAKQGKGLDPLVDPSKYDVIRYANNLLVPKGDEFVLEFGVAMPVESNLDTTGSMGGNVDIAFKVLPKVQNLLVQGKNAVLRRYHTQIATGVIQDVADSFPYQRSQFEPDNEVERQMGLLVPEKYGGDSTEDYQYGLFAAAYLTKASITQYGLRGYYFVVGDEIGRDGLKKTDLERIFGPTVMEKAFGPNPPKSLPSTREIGAKLLENWHGFYLQVGNNSYTTNWWSEVLGKERVVILPRTEDIAEIQACIIGLTEGVLGPRNILDFLDEEKVERQRSAKIIEAVREITIGLQQTFPNFSKIPAAGAKFASRDDIWPIGVKESKPKKKDSAAAKEPRKDKKNWKL
jgi:hypothetical protein